MPLLASEWLQSLESLTSTHAFFIIAQFEMLTVKRLAISNVKLYVMPLKYKVFILGAIDTGVSVSEEEGHGSVTKRVNVCFTKLQESESTEG